MPPPLPSKIKYFPQPHRASGVTLFCAFYTRSSMMRSLESQKECGQSTVYGNSASNASTCGRIYVTSSWHLSVEFSLHATGVATLHALPSLISGILHLVWRPMRSILPSVERFTLLLFTVVVIHAVKPVEKSLKPSKNRTVEQPWSPEEVYINK